MVLAIVGLVMSASKVGLTEIHWILGAALLMQVMGIFAILEGFYLEDGLTRFLGVSSLLLGTLIRLVEYHVDHHLGKPESVPEEP
jgi:hypothetical protein